MNSDNWILKINLVGVPHSLAMDLTHLVNPNRNSICSVLDTIGVDVNTENIRVDNEIVRMIFCNVNADNKYRELRQAYYQGAFAAVFFFLKDDLEALNKIRDLHTEFTLSSSEDSQRALVGIVDETNGNKKSQAEDLAKILGIPYYEMKNTDNIGFNEMITELVSIHIDSLKS
ncbi:MAG: hypothetical protein ACFFB5_12525 [Promethearchaeota archaeon]